MFGEQGGLAADEREGRKVSVVVGVLPLWKSVRYLTYFLCPPPTRIARVSFHSAHLLTQTRSLFLLPFLTPPLSSFLELPSCSV